MTLGVILLATAAILPSDRMAMADRLFDRGDFAAARTEYAALTGEKGIAGDELLFRLAESARACGDLSAARASYQELLKAYPGSRHAPRARLKGALAGTAAERAAELPALDAPGVPAAIRAEALYHLAELKGDPALYAKAVKAEPKGPFATAAKFRRAALLEKSQKPEERRTALGLFYELSKSTDKTTARKALYMAICCCYKEKSPLLPTLVNRYYRDYPGGAEEADVRVMHAWALYRDGKFTDAELACGDVESDELAYLRAVCAQAKKDSALARKRYAAYLESYPEGRSRAEAELQLARLNYLAVKDGEDKSLIIEAARQSAKISGDAADRLRYAWALESAGHTDDAIAEYAALAREAPKTPSAAEALFRKALIDLRASRFSAAEQTLGEALANGLPEEREAEALYWRGVASAQIGHDTEGARFVSEALKKGLPKDLAREGKLKLADFAFKQGREADAKDAYAELLMSDNEACGRLAASRLRNLGMFLLSDRGGAARPDAAEVCARALVTSSKDATWRQTGYVLLGEAQEAAGFPSLAIEAYRAAVKEGATTEDLPPAVLALGILETKAGESAAAAETLALAVRLFATDPTRRVQAYVWLAKNAQLAGAKADARRYATIVETLFDDKDASAEAAEILKACAEDGK